MTSTVNSLGSGDQVGARSVSESVSLRSQKIGVEVVEGDTKADPINIGIDIPVDLFSLEENLGDRNSEVRVVLLVHEVLLSLRGVSGDSQQQELEVRLLVVKRVFLNSALIVNDGRLELV